MARVLPKPQYSSGTNAAQKTVTPAKKSEPTSVLDVDAKTWAAYEEWKKKKKEQAQAQLRQEAAKSWNQTSQNLQKYFNNSQQFMTAAQNDYGTMNYSNAADMYATKSRSAEMLRSEGRELMKWMNQYGELLDEDTRKATNSYLRQMDIEYGKIMDSYGQKNDFIGSFETEDDYLKWDAYTTPEKRQARYEENKAKLADLEAKRQAMTWGTVRDTSEVDAEINAIKQEMAMYKRGNTDEDGFYYGSKAVDDYSKYLTDPAFSKYSGMRDYGIPTAEDFDRADEAMARGDGSGMIRLEDITDPLGVYKANAGYTDNNGVLSFRDMIMQSGNEGSWNQLTEEEEGIYYTILGTQGKGAAMQYLNDMQVELNRRAMTENSAAIDQAFAEADGWERFGMSAKSIPTNLIGGGIAFIDDAARTLTGQEINPYSSAHTLQNYGQRVRSNQAAAFDEASDWEIPGINFSAGDLYQALMSTGDMAAGAFLGPTAYGALMGMGAASSEAKRLYEMGASKAQIALGAAAAGGAELLFERWSIEKLISIKDADTLFKVVLNALKQGGIEASEEGTTELANLISNHLIMTSESDWSKLIEKHNGDKGAARREAISQIGEAAAGGFVSGFLGGGATAGAQYVGNYANDAQQGAAIREGKGLDPLRELALAKAEAETGRTQKDLKKQSERLGKDFLTEIGKDRAAGRLYRTVQNSVTEANKADIAAALQEQGYSKKTANTIADAFYAEAVGMKLSDDQKKVMKKYGSNDAIQKVVGDMLLDGESSIAKRNQNLRDFRFDVIKNQLTAQLEKATGEKIYLAEMDAEENIGDSAPALTVSDDGSAKVISTGESVNITGFAPNKDGKAMLSTDNGNTVAVDDVAYASDSDALVYEAIASLGASASASNGLLKAYRSKSGVDAEVFARGIQEAFEYGRMGIPMSEMEGSMAAQLSEYQMQYAYNRGVEMAKTQKLRNRYATKAAVKAAESVATNGQREHRVVLDDNISVDEMTVSQKVTYDYLNQIVKGIKGEIHVYSAKTGEMGYYDKHNDRIYLNINATNKSEKALMVFVLGHELVHRAKVGSPEKYEAFKDFLLEQYGKRGASVEDMIDQQIAAAKEQNIKMTREEALEEVVCDACQRMLLDTDAGKRLAAFGAQSEQNRTFLGEIRRIIHEFMEKMRAIFTGVNADSSLAAEEFNKFDIQVKRILADMYVDMTMEAGKNLDTIMNAYGKNTLVELTKDGEVALVQNEDGSQKVFNLVTWENGGRETLVATLKREGYTEDDIKAALTIMDANHKLVKDIASELNADGKPVFPEQGRINEATLTTDIKDGHSVLSALVSNGDYPVNIDLLMVCKKRKAYQRVINRLCETGMIKQATVDSLAIAEINKILGKHGFETACLGCFVESRRLRIQEWAETIVKEWNSEVKKRNPNAKAFGFGKGGGKLGADEIMQLIGELESGGEKNEKGNLNLGVGSAVKRMGVLLDKVPTLRRTLTVDDLITPDGLSRLRRFDSNLFSMVKSRYGSNSPKFVQEFNPYNHELAMYGKVPSQYESLREYLYAIGGARMQSFSDFIVENWFDYCQIVADLAARKLPMHTYTKEIAMVKLFGMTGIKINMSLIPDVDKTLGKEYAGLTRNADGKLELIWADKDRNKATGGKSYMQSINASEAFALQNDPRYSANIGTIAIGISDMQIRMMLNDSRIRMVIPYHSSGMNPIFADMMGTSFYKDYTNYQNTTIKQMYNSKGQPVSVKLTKPQIAQLTSGFLFNDVLRELGDARAAAEAYKEWCADSSKHSITIKGETYTAELTPKFDDFSREPNYYKLLEDFNTYDCITEQAAPQGDVQQIYPEGFEKILRSELKSQETHRQTQAENKAFDKAMGEIESYLKSHTKADTVYYAQQHGIKLSKKDSQLDAAGKERLKQLKEQGASFMLKKEEKENHRKPAYYEWNVQTALYDALDHADDGDDNMIRVGEIPRYVTEKIGIEGDFYIYRNHAYENMVSEEKANEDERPITRKGEKIHFHNLGVDTMTEAIMSMEHPTMAIATKTAEGNPAVIMILPVKGKNNAPLYAVLSFYSNRPINGDLSRKPHVVLTIAERDFFGSNGRGGYAEIVGRAVLEGRVIDFNKEMRDDLSVIANPAGVGNITDSSLSDNLARFRKEIKSFREKNHIDYKLPIGESTTEQAKSRAETRLERKLESATAKQSELIRKNRAIRAELSQQKKDISIYEKEFARLAKAYEKQMEKDGKADAKSKDTIKEFRAALIKEANSHKEDQKIWYKEFSRLLKEYEYYGRQISRMEDKIQEQRSRAKEKVESHRRTEMRHKIQEQRSRAKEKVESHRRTEMRHKIQNVVSELNRLLLSNDKKAHVPDSLKKAVADALDLVNMDTVDAEALAAKYAALIEKETDPDKIAAYTVTMENILRQGEKVGQRLRELRSAYEDIQKSTDPDIANAYDPVIAGNLQELAESIGNTSIKNMTIEQLSDVYDMYKMVLTRVRDANKALVENMRASIGAMADDVIGEVKQVGGEQKYRIASLDSVKKFLWNNLKPVYAMETIGSSTLTKVYENVRAGEDTWAVDVTDARKFYLANAKKYGYNKWDFNKKNRFESTSGISFDLTLEQILSLYAYSKREQAHDHLRLGGFVFDSNIETTKEGRNKLIKYKVNTADAHQISPEILADIVGTLTKEQKQFVDAMQGYLSDVMGAKGNEVTMKMYGVKLFKEQNYFPLKSAKQFMFEQNEVSGEVRIKNSGFTNKVVAKANNPVILSNFMDVWSGHVDAMSMYHAFTLPLEDFNRVFNYNTPKAEGQESVSVKGTIQNAYGPAAVSYVKQLITDLNGGARSDSTTGFINKMMGKFKKGAVFASLSVVVQQPSAIARAAALIDTKYFVGRKVDPQRHRMLWEEVKRYAPVAIIKEMGYFDTSVGKSTQDFIQGKEYEGITEQMKALFTDGDFRDEILSKGPALADELAWCGIWEAVKRETKDKHPKMDGRSSEFLKLCGTRFTEVITKTQVYDSVMSRSANMRSKDTGMKMATAFMAEPTTSINMITDALLKGKRGDKKFARKAIGAVIASQILNAFLVSWVYAIRDDDEDESFHEKQVNAFVGSLLDGLNPIAYIPFLRDIISIVQGYDVERSDMAVISDLWKAVQNLTNDRVSPYMKVEGFVGAIAQIFGLPAKNIMRDTRGVYNTLFGHMDRVSTSAGFSHAFKSALPKWMGGGVVSNQNQLYDAYINDDEKQIVRVEGRYEEESDAHAALRKALRENDPRILEAAVALNDDDYGTYLDIVEEIMHEGHFDRDDVIKAIRSEASALAPEESSGVSKTQALMSAEQFAIAVANGETTVAEIAMEDIIATAQENGKTEEEAVNSFQSSAKSALKDQYIEEKTLSDKDAEKALVTYCDMDQDEAVSTVRKWAFEAESGFVYGSLHDEYIKSNITASEARKAMITYGGMTGEKADDTIETWDFEKKHGYAWADRIEEYKDGNISRSELRSAIIESGKTGEEADITIKSYDWQMSGYTDATYTMVRDYEAHCAAYNIPISVYYQIRKFANETENDVVNGHPVRYSAMKKVMAMIGSQPGLTDAQKTAIAKSIGWSDRNIRKYKTW